MKQFEKRILPILLCGCLLMTGVVGLTLAKYIWSRTERITLSADYTAETEPPTPTIPPSAPVLGDYGVLKAADLQEAQYIRFVIKSNPGSVSSIDGVSVIPADNRSSPYNVGTDENPIYFYVNKEKIEGSKTDNQIFGNDKIGKEDVGYFVAASTIYLPEDCTYLFNGDTNKADCNAIMIDFTNVNTSCVKNMTGMFAENSNLVTLNMRTFTMESLTNISGMFKNCTKLSSIQVTALDGTDRTSGFEPALISGITLGTDTFSSTNLTYKSGGEYAKVSGGNFTAISRMVYAAEPTPDYILNTDDVTDMTLIETLTEEGLELRLIPNEGFTLPECVFVTIGGKDYFIYTTEDGPENPEGITFDPAGSILFISRSLLPIDGSEIILSANAEEAPPETEPMEETTEPTEEPTEEPTGEATEPTEETTEPTEEVTEPAEEPTEAPTEAPTEPPATEQPTEAPTTESVQDME